LEFTDTHICVSSNRVRHTPPHTVTELYRRSCSPPGHWRVEVPTRLCSDDGQTGSYRFVRRSSTDKCACVDWSASLPSGRQLGSHRPTRLVHGVSSAVRLGAPICRPSKIGCIGLNFRDHASKAHWPRRMPGAMSLRRAKSSSPSAARLPELRFAPKRVTRRLYILVPLRNSGESDHGGGGGTAYNSVFVR
jgi:hypothetical protein